MPFRHYHAEILNIAGKALFGFLIAAAMAGSCAFADKFSLTYAEQVGDKLIGAKDPDTGEVSYDTATKGSFTAVATYAWAKVDGEDQFDFRALTADTVFAFSIGNFTHEGALSDDPKYVDGAKSATIIIKEDPSDPKSKNAIKIKISGGKNKLQIIVTGRYPQTVVADDYLGRTKPVEAIIFMSFNISDADIANDVLITVRPRVVTKIIGKGDDQQEFELQSVSLKGRSLLMSNE
ncbi:MAG: hypothetical protein NTX50_08950 [Candidatus Sumerlaeota bacterium]|nr:hypothetical protein [Candidatus Sumerlaeota bacterium]